MDEEGRADDKTMGAAIEAVDRVIDKLMTDHGMIMPDIIIVLINAAVTLAFETWKGPEDAETNGPEDAKAIIRDTVEASLEDAMAEARRRGPDGELSH